MHEVQRSSSHPRSEDRDLFKLAHQIAPNHDLDCKRKFRHVATREGTDQTIKRSIPTPAIVLFARYAIQTESNMRNGGTVCLERGPDSLEMPAVSNKADRQVRVADDSKCFRKLRMKRRLATGETDPRDVSGSLGLADYPS